MSSLSPSAAATDGLMCLKPQQPLRFAITTSLSSFCFWMGVIVWKHKHLIYYHYELCVTCSLLTFSGSSCELPTWCTGLTWGKMKNIVMFAIGGLPVRL